MTELTTDHSLKPSLSGTLPPRWGLCWRYFVTMTEMTTAYSLKPSLSGTLPPNSAVIGYATEEEVLVSVHLSTEMVPVSFML